MVKLIKKRAFGVGMHKLTLPPEQILVPGEYELHSEDLLKVYFRVFERGHGQDLPPVLVCRSDLLSPAERPKLYIKPVLRSFHWLGSHLGAALAADTEDDSIESLLAKIHTAQQSAVGSYHQYCGDLLERIPLYQRRVAIFEQRIVECDYFLLDGNHRSAAATLARQPIYALSIETDDDVVEVRRMVERGELFNFQRTEDSIEKVYASFVEYILGEELNPLAGRMEDLRTVKERIDELVSSDGLPAYMKERYLRC